MCLEIKLFLEVPYILFAEFRQLGHYQTRDKIGAAAGCVGQDELHRARGLPLRLGNARNGGYDRQNRESCSCHASLQLKHINAWSVYRVQNTY